jgi:hypothetical protein
VIFSAFYREIYNNMSSEGNENTGETANDRLQGSQETPLSPAVAPPPLTQRPPEEFQPSEEQQLQHAADTLQQEKMAALIGHLSAFRQGPEHVDCDVEAYDALTRIPGLALGPLADMLSKGAAIRLQLDKFISSQATMRS